MTLPDADEWAAPAPPSTLRPAERAEAERLIVDVDGYEGPLDLLLSLSRSQKVDLRRVSILQLVEQYLGYVARMQSLRIELAADYLVMAAWLAYLKSRLLLPEVPGEDGPSAADLAAHLAFQLERLAAMREMAARLMARDQKGRDFFARGAPQSQTLRRRVEVRATLIDLLRAYARIRTRDEFRPYAFDRRNIYTMEEALERMRGLIGFDGAWAELGSFLPEGWQISPERRRSATASNFAAMLEMAKAGQIAIRQAEVFAAIQIRRRQGEA